jgi:ribosomal protein RSM22 (predicted rRNA methylase)
MGRRRIHGSSEGTLSVDERLLEAMESLYGPLDDRQNLDRIGEGLETLHRGLTGQRSRFTKRPYLRDAQLLRAYGSYIVCAQAPKLKPVLDRIAFDHTRPVRILELGCGPGTGVAGVGLWAKDRGLSVEHIATDRVQEALDATTQLAQALDLDGVSTIKVDLGTPLARQIGRQDRFDMILCMNVLNELPIERFSLLIREFAHWLRPDGKIVAIEPAAREPARHILEIRDMLISRDWFVHAPCPHQGECPAFEQEDDWCHDAWAFDRPEFMGEVDKRVGTRRESLKATWFIFSQIDPLVEETPGLGRVVSDRFEEKGRTHARVCTAHGLIDLELQNRDRSESNRDFRKIHRYDLIQFDGTETVGRRERLTAESACTLIDEKP